LSFSRPLLSLASWAARILPTSLKRRLYQARPLADLIRRSLNRAAPQGLTIVEVAAGGLAGYRMQLDLRSEKDYWLGTYEPELQAALEALLKPGMIAYDVGANIGYISLLLARYVGERGRVFAFEALPANLKRLRVNLELNNMLGLVEIVPAAVVDEERPVQFLVGPSNGMGKVEGSAGRQGDIYRENLTVAGVSLDAFAYRLERPAPDVVKMDIEGGEALALPGMKRLLKEAHPLLLLELHGSQSAQIAWGLLTEAGYRLCQMRPKFPPIASLEELDWKAYVAAFPPNHG
jgi:FkbM family methyltransferase